MILQTTDDVADFLLEAADAILTDEAGRSEPRTTAGLTPTATVFDVWTVEGKTFRVTVTEIRGAA